MIIRMPRSSLATAALALGLMCTQAAAAEDNCSPAGFHDYYNQVIKDPSNIANISSAPYVLRTLTSLKAGSGPHFLVTKYVNTGTLKQFESAAARQNHIQPSVSSYDDVVVIDDTAKYLIIYKFENKSCWQLSAVEDWRLDGAVPTAVGDDTKGEGSLLRGDVYSELGIHEESNSRIYLFAAALRSYVAGANAGSDKSAFKAVALSLSGEAPRLNDSDILRLLKQSAASSEEGALALADFYCDEGREDKPASCLNPTAANDALGKAGRMGSSEAIYKLAQHYESGDGVAKDLEKALSCYKAAVNADSAYEQDVHRLESQGVKANKENCKI